MYVYDALNDDFNLINNETFTDVDDGAVEKFSGNICSVSLSAFGLKYLFIV